MPKNSNEIILYSSHASPKVVCIEEAVELGIDSDDIDSPTSRIPDDSALELARSSILLGIDAQGAIDLQLEHVFILDTLLPLAALVPGLLDHTQLVLEPPQLPLQSLALDLELRGGLRDAEFLSVEGEDVLGVAGWVVARDFRLELLLLVMQAARDLAEGLGLGL